MDKFRWMPEEEADPAIVGNDFPPATLDSDASSYNNNTNMAGEMDDCMATIMDETMENDPEDQPPLGSDDEEQVYYAKYREEKPGA